MPNSPDRRAFLVSAAKSAAIATGAVGIGFGLSRGSRVSADDGVQIATAIDPAIKITRVVGFELPLRRAKVAGRNAYKDVHGETSSDAMVRIYTSAGVDGIGACNANEKAAAELVGKSLASLYDAKRGRMTGPLGAGTMPLWDVAGKLLAKPVYTLLGGGEQKHEAAGKSARITAPVYDGSIYFADLLPQYADRWQDRFREEIDQGAERGHIAYKIKIGRGKKWMKREEGDRRDIEIVELIRKHAGPKVLLFVDANNGYDLAGAKRFIEATADCHLGFAEEMFEEAVEPCLEFKKHMAAKGINTLLADGETQNKLDPFAPLLAAGAIDIMQGDMKHFGFEGILDEAAMASTAPNKVTIAPHNWGSLLGFYMQLHIARALPNFYRAEHDPLSSEMLSADGYKIKGGKATLSEAPGFGLALDEKKFAAAKLRFDVK